MLPSVFAILLLHFLLPNLGSFGFLIWEGHGSCMPPYPCFSDYKAFGGGGFIHQSLKNEYIYSTGVSLGLKTWVLRKQCNLNCVPILPDVLGI